MCRLLACVTVALSAALPLTAHAETRTIAWQGQNIIASVSEPTRGPGLSREQLLDLARRAVPITPSYELPPANGAPRTDGDRQ